MIVKKLISLKEAVLMVSFCGFFLVFASQEIIKPKLCNMVIKWLDNKPFALDAVAMGDILHVRRELRKIQHGVQDSGSQKKQFVGYYIFQDEKRTLHWLADYERAMDKEFAEQKIVLEEKYLDYKAYSADWELEKVKLAMAYQKTVHEGQEQIKRTLKDSDEHDYEATKLQKNAMKEFELLCNTREEEIKNKYIKNSEGYQQELHALRKAYGQKITELKPCLQAAKNDFIKANEPFAAKMEGTKVMLLKLVAEFCLKYKRPYSFLLEWADVADGQEFIAFERNMISCKALDVFITDLADFLEALYRSCEKARAEFEAKQKEKLQKK